MPTERSRGEIERILERYGATAFGYLTDESEAVIAFKANGKSVRFTIPLPAIDDEAVVYTAAGRRNGRVRPQRERPKAREQEIRRRWRALALAIKAKLEAVESGIVTFEEEFMAHFVLPSGRTVGEVVGDDMAQLEQADVPLLEAGA